MKTLIKNGSVVLPNGMENVTLELENGKIAAVIKPDDPINESDCRVIDATGKIVMPGMIDTHNHMCDPGPYNYREDWSCGSKSAASGGITTICDMPLPCEPEVLNRTSFEVKLSAVKSQSVVDYAFWAGITPKNLDCLHELIQLGCIGFKGFMCFATESYPRITDNALDEGLAITSEANALVALHCENAEAAAAGQNSYSDRKCDDEACFDDARPWWVEYDAVRRAVLLAEKHNARIEVCHLSSVQTAEYLKEKKIAGSKVFVETCPHYLLFDKDVLRTVKAFGKCTPPFRSRENVEMLWEYVFDGTIDVLGSDHGPFTDAEKTEKNDFWTEFCGFGCNDVMLSAMISEGVNRRGLSWEKLAELTSSNAAKMLGIYPQKGCLLPGSDADFIFIDPNEEWVYDGALSFSKTKSTRGVYQGMKLKGRITDTFVRGERVYGSGKILVKDGYGKFVNPLVK